jgi:hypothetical protein
VAWQNDLAKILKYSPLLVSTESVKDTLELDIEAVAGGDKNRESFLTDPPFPVVPGADLTIARSSKYNYNDHGMEWNNSGKNGFYCKFKYSP